MLLTVDQKIELSELEQKVEAGLKGFYAAGQALTLIQEKGLYPQATFELYCKEKWSFTPQYANRLKAAFKVVQALRDTYAAETMVSAQLPETERQARPLTQLPAEQRLPAWETAVEISPKGSPTAAEVSEAAEAVQAEPQEWTPATSIEVLTGPDKGKIVTVIAADESKPLVTCQTEAGETKSYLSTQLTGHTPPPAVSARPAKKEPPKEAAYIETLGANLEIEKERLEILEESASALAIAVSLLMASLEEEKPPAKTVIKDVKTALKDVVKLLGLVP